MPLGGDLRSVLYKACLFARCGRLQQPLKDFFLGCSVSLCLRLSSTDALLSEARGPCWRRAQ
eukprot:3971942-Lingulodinium_polyedra.AAC.1